ncbi:MAG: tail fiber domain-containing protein [Saprospiraceae bacterium]|nr:tail fiber domain-containing protein [Saprospiraceae bacterium]
MLKRALLWVVLLMAAPGVYAQQAPQGFNYQCIVRDPGGNPVSNQAVTLLFSIRSGIPNGPVAYSERHTTSTNDYGLTNLVVGQGTPFQGTFAGINWGSAAHFLSVSLETSPNVFDELGASQLMSVPYALYAQNGGNGGDDWGAQVVQTTAVLSGEGTVGNPLTLASQGAQIGQVLKWNGAQWVPQDDISDTGTGGGTVTEIGTGVGLQGGPITTSGIISLSNTGVAPGQYGGNDRIPVITVDAQGRITGIQLDTLSGGGLLLDAGNGIEVIQNGNIVTIVNTGDLDPLNDLTQFSIAGGDLTGPYDNLQIKAQTVGSAEIIDKSVGSGQMQDGAVGATQLAGNAVVSGKIADGAVETSKLANQSVTADKIRAGAVETAHLADFSVTTPKLADRAVTPDKLATLGAAAGQVIKWNGSTWVAADDLLGSSASPTTLNPGPGISIAGTGPAFTITNTGDLDPSNDLTTTSIAGGDIDGVFSALVIKPGVITDAEMAPDAIRNVNIQNKTITGNKLADMGAINGQVLKWNGSTWAPADDQNSGINLIPGPGIDITVSGSNYIITNEGDPFPFDDVTIITIADGDVTGTYDDLQIRPAAVGNIELAANAVSTGNIQNGAVIAAKLNQMGATGGQVLKWNGTVWAPSADNIGGDNWGTQVVATGNTLSGNGTLLSPLNLAQQGAFPGQVLKWSGTGWSPGIDQTGNNYAAGTGISITGTAPNLIINNTGDADRDSLNELQNLALNGTLLSLSNSAVSVDLDTLIADAGYWSLDTSGNIANQNPGKVLVGAGGLELENTGAGATWTFLVDNGAGNMVLLHNGTAVGNFAPDGMYTPSDRRLKADIAGMRAVLPKILQLQPVTYRYNRFPESTKRSIGFIAQDVQVLFPELVSHTDGRNNHEEHYAVNYAGMSVLAIQAIREQQELIQQLHAENKLMSERIDLLEKRLEKLEKR